MQRTHFQVSTVGLFVKKQRIFEIFVKKTKKIGE
jgi:hypothetical protein